MAAAVTTPPPSLDVGELLQSTLGGVVQGVAHAAASSPVVLALVILVAVTMVVRVVRFVRYLGWRRDPVRLFTRTDKAALLLRAGHRCEKHVLLAGRCRAEAKLEADHVHPWSRGGQTALPNGQVLCQQHNRQKRASVPFSWQIRRLERRRAAYFPTGTPTSVTRRPSRSHTRAASAA